MFPVVPAVPPFWGSFEDVKNRLRWKNLNAIKIGKLYEIPRDLISRTGPRLVEALEMLEKMIHNSL